MFRQTDDIGKNVQKFVEQGISFLRDLLILWSTIFLANIIGLPGDFA